MHINTCMHAVLYVNTYVCASVHVYTCMCVCMFVCNVILCLLPDGALCPLS